MLLVYLQKKGCYPFFSIFMWLVNFFSKLPGFDCHTVMSIIKFDIYKLKIDLNFLQEGLKIAAPLLIGRLLSYFTPVPGISKTDAYITATLLSVVALTEGTIHAPNFFKNQRHGLHLRIAAGSLIYRKVGTVHCYLLLDICTTKCFNITRSNEYRR